MASVHQVTASHLSQLQHPLTQQTALVINMTLVHVAGDVVTRDTCRWSRDGVTVRAALLQLMGGGWAVVGLGWAVALLHCVNRSNRC